MLPDSAVRVTLLDFDSLPERRQEAEAAVRFRLRKSLPFDIEKAALSFDAQKTPQGLHVAAAVVLQSVLEEYESAFRAAGCSPGVVLPSSLGALGAVDEDRPTMLLKIGQDATSIAVVKDGQLLLFRILEGAETEALTAERMADDIYPSLVYFQDNYGVSVEQLLVSGVRELDELVTCAGAADRRQGQRTDRVERGVRITCATILLEQLERCSRKEERNSATEHQSGNEAVPGCPPHPAAMGRAGAAACGLHGGAGVDGGFHLAGIARRECKDRRVAIRDRRAGPAA